MIYVSQSSSLKVKNITPDPVKSECVRVRIADEIFVIDAEALGRLDIRDGEMLSEEQYANVVFAAQLVAARERAIQLLTRKSYTIREIQLRLKRYDIDEDVIDHVVSWLQQLRYIDDRRYAQQWVEQRIRLRGYGPLRLQRELQQKGVDRRYIDEALAPYDEEHFVALAWEHGEKYVRRHLGEDTMAVRRKVYAYLQRRGFSTPIIHRVVQRVEEQFLS